MSRNRCSTACACGFLDLRDTAGAVAPDVDGLLTWDGYFEAIGWRGSRDNLGYGCGHGFRADRNGAESPLWRRKDGMGSTNARHHAEPLDEFGYVPFVYCRIPEEQRYRLRKVTCPVCRRVYAGWYVMQPRYVRPYVEPLVYELYDTSYWSTYNDEPGDDDVRDVELPGLLALAAPRLQKLAGPVQL